ncbi:MAG: ATP-binding cassette domain-containing protein [Alphaproteobacteria bacterium]|nr:ATP-binding cassette domain-containing protein [Alphaproteobacteria bacterium]TAD88043.1 MAG: ATP-binding cassette domain-containing protein [Alphaproteobacteria bacterium]
MPLDAAPTATLLSATGLSITFDMGVGGLLARLTGAKRQQLRAVNAVDLTIASGETLALVGESGCGKTTLGRAVVGLYRPTAGTISWQGTDITDLASPARKSSRREIQMIFQDPYGSLNPRLPVSEVLKEPLRIHGIGNAAEQDARARTLIQQVGLPVDALNRYPHQFSGGQRQRIAIARALGPMPKLIVADEPLSALDVSIQSQILNLMADLRTQHQLSYLLISHDLGAVNHLADRVAVMYLGRIVEIGPRDDLFSRPAHPYTQALVEAIPRVGQGKRRRGRSISGDVPSPINPPTGCAFHPRCPKAQDICKSDLPALTALGDLSHHAAACHFPERQP